VPSARRRAPAAPHDGGSLAGKDSAKISSISASTRSRAASPAAARRTPPPAQLPESPSASHASSDLCRSDGGVDVALGKHANDGAAFDDERPLEIKI
jgi:hypothetical protein